MSKAEKRSRRKLPPMEVGQIYGRLTAIEYLGRAKRHNMWRFLCDCGKEHATSANNVRTGHTQSCGCLFEEKKRESRTTHGLIKTKAYSSYRDMLNRCYNANLHSYHRYGGRGIVVSERWRTSFQNFFDDMGDRPEGKTLERVDNNGPYSKENCCWATKKEQRINQSRTVVVIYQGERVNLAEAAKRANKYPSTVERRIKRGWTVERALSEPSREPPPSF